MDISILLGKIRDRLRAAPWLILGLIGLSWLVLFAPHKVGVLIWLMTKLSLAGYVGYWLDRLMFPYARPHMTGQITENAGWRYLRRALIVGCALIAAGLQA